MCYGLNRDDSIKKGQIAHLDGNRDNNEPENLAFLCFDHHDEYDSTTSQSKGLLRAEVEQYKEELQRHFGSWSLNSGRDALLNFLSFNADLDAVAGAAIKVGKTLVYFGENLAFEVLTRDSATYTDSDLYVPYIAALDHFASWGLLTYTEEETQDLEGMTAVSVRVKRSQFCDEVAWRMVGIIREKGESTAALERSAECYGWNPPRPF
ncbi:MAG: hypothetical protein PHI97_13075 [Desulfobulbus sp.]|nr:hypothetical protein [Desulfobulbus sp.]